MVQIDVIASETDRLADAQAMTVQRKNQAIIADPVPPHLGRVEQGSDLPGGGCQFLTQEPVLSAISGGPLDLTLPGAGSIIRLYDHQKRVIWRVVAAGSTYIAHSVGVGKSYAIAGAIMEQKRLGLISKAMLVVPGHCLAQVSREFLQLYPTPAFLVADESNFVKEKRSRFLARAATANWDAVIITHAAFRFISVPARFERAMIAPPAHHR
jgi:N12 class adenine-specific DNA methylase